MVEDKVDAGAGRQGGELLQQLDRREEEMTRSVVPLALERDEDESVGRQGEALLRHRRAGASCMSSPRRDRRRRTRRWMVARSRATSASLGGSAAWNARVPSARSAKTPSTSRL